MLTRVLTLAAVLGMTAILSLPAAATTVLKVDVDAMTRISDWIVRAEVVSSTPVDLRPQGGTLYTDIGLKVQTVYQGKSVPALTTIRMMGGLGADGLAVTIPGMPTFRVGDEVVVFLEKTKRGFVPCGLEQGVYRVRTVASVPYVHRDSNGAHLVTRHVDGSLTPAEHVALTSATTLGQLEDQIRAAQATLRATVPTVAPASPLAR